MDKIYIVMDYVEHDLKVLMEHMTQGFRMGELLFLLLLLFQSAYNVLMQCVIHRTELLHK